MGWWRRWTERRPAGYLRFPDPPEGGMTYANWRFGRPGLSRVRSSFHLDNDPGPDSHLYLQLYDAPIDGQPTYHGVQTSDLAIFSRFGTTDAGHVRPAAGATVVTGTDEGPYVSVRRPFALDVGSYWSELRRSGHQGDGDWFEYVVGRAGGAEPAAETVVGAIWFPRRRPESPATLADGGGSWTEFWDNNGPVLHPVPLWRLRLELPTAEDGLTPEGVTFAYSRMPNADIGWDPAAAQVTFVLGADTRRSTGTPRTVRLR